MANFFNKTLCSLLTAGFIFWGFDSLNKYEEELSPSANLAPVQTYVQPTQTSYDLTIKSPVGIDKSHFYLLKGASLDEGISLDYQKPLLPKSNYVFRNEQLVTKSQAREKLYEYFGLDSLLFLPNKINIYDDSALDAKICFKFLKLEDLLNSSSEERKMQWLGPLKSAELSINLKF